MPERRIYGCTINLLLHFDFIRGFCSFEFRSIVHQNVFSCQGNDCFNVELVGGIFSRGGMKSGLFGVLGFLTSLIRRKK